MCHTECLPLCKSFLRSTFFPLAKLNSRLKKTQPKRRGDWDVKLIMPPRDGTWKNMKVLIRILLLISLLKLFSEKQVVFSCKNWSWKSCMVSSLVYVLNKINTTDKLGKIERRVMAFNQRLILSHKTNSTRKLTLKISAPLTNTPIWCLSLDTYTRKIKSR